MPADITWTDFDMERAGRSRLGGRHGPSTPTSSSMRPPASPPPMRRSRRAASPPRAILTPCFRPGPRAPSALASASSAAAFAFSRAPRPPRDSSFALSADRIRIGPSRSGKYIFSASSRCCAIVQAVGARRCVHTSHQRLTPPSSHAKCSPSSLSRTRRRRLPPHSTSTPPRPRQRRRDVGAALRRSRGA